MSPESGDSIRAHTYGLLAGLLSAPPTNERLDLLKQIGDAAPDDDRSLAVAWQALRMAAERASVEALDDEYHDLFIGVGRGELVPYGSWYLTGFLMEQPLAVLRRDLAALGFERHDDVHEPEDHAAALCETMAMLITNEDTPFETQRRFFDNHLALWIGKFFSDLRDARSARFYRAVGQLGYAFVEFEKQYLTMSV